MSEWQGRCIPYLRGVSIGQRREGLWLRWSRQEVPRKSLRVIRLLLLLLILSCDIFAGKSAAHISDRVNARRGLGLFVDGLLGVGRMQILLVGGLLTRLLLLLWLLLRLLWLHPRRLLLRLMVVRLRCVVVHDLWRQGRPWLGRCSMIRSAKHRRRSRGMIRSGRRGCRIKRVRRGRFRQIVVHLRRSGIATQRQLWWHIHVCWCK